MYSYTKVKWISSYTVKFQGKGGRKNVFKGCYIVIDKNVLKYLLKINKDLVMSYLSEVLNLETFYVCVLKVIKGEFIIIHGVYIANR